MVVNFNEYEKRIAQLEKRYLKGEVSQLDVQREITHLLGEDNLVYRLKERLTQEINSRLSLKAKEKLSNVRAYFLRRAELESEVIFSNFPYAFFRDECTTEEIEALDIGVFDPKTLMLVIIQALKSHVDNGLEDDPKAIALHGLYLRLKQELNSEIPFESGDGFAEYIANREFREQVKDAPFSGEICKFCGSHNVTSYGNQWQCNDCKRHFRKHTHK